MVQTFEGRPFGRKIVVIVDIGVVAGDLEAGEIQRATDCARTADGGVGHSLGAHGGCCWVGVTGSTVVAVIAVSTAAASRRVSN